MTVNSCEGSVDKRQRLIPYADPIVLEVDLDGSEIQVNWDPDF